MYIGIFKGVFLVPSSCLPFISFFFFQSFIYMFLALVFWLDLVPSSFSDP